MRLTNEQRIEIILMAGSGSNRMVAAEFNGKHGTSITHNTVAKLICKFKKTGNVADQPQSGPRCRATDEDTSAHMKTHLYGVREKVHDSCLQKLVSADRASGAF